MNSKIDKLVLITAITVVIVTTVWIYLKDKTSTEHLDIKTQQTLIHKQVEKTEQISDKIVVDEVVTKTDKDVTVRRKTTFVKPAIIQRSSIQEQVLQETEVHQKESRPSRGHAVIGVSLGIGRDPGNPANWQPHVSIPVLGPVNIYAQTNLKLTQVSVGFDLVL